MTPFPPDGVVSGATNPPSPEHGQDPSGNAGSGDLSGPDGWQAVQALAALLQPEAFDPGQPASEEWRNRMQDEARGYAAKVITSGYRRVVVDVGTVDRVAAALATDDAIDWDYVQGSARSGSKWARNEVARFHSLARAAVRALREDTP